MDEPVVIKRLYKEPFAFDFFQAVRLLQRTPTAMAGLESTRAVKEVARFRAHLSMSFPASSIYDIIPSESLNQPPTMVVTFMGLFGPSGVLPTHYTSRIIERERSRPRAWDSYDDRVKEAYDKERRAFRDWLDLFNHRFVHLFYRAWEKYRFYLPQERREAELNEPDNFSRAMLSYIGLGTTGLRNRLRITASPTEPFEPDQELARIHDLGLIRFAGFLSQQHRNPWALQVMLASYFGLPIEIQQFRGQWLPLEVANQSRLGAEDGNCDLGVNMVVGTRVWDVQGKFRIRIGPLSYPHFLEYMPDRSPVPARKTFFLLAQLTRFYVGPEFDFDVQLVLRAADVPTCRLTQDSASGPRLGWNCWLLSRTPMNDVDDAVFEGKALTHVGGKRRTESFVHS